MRPVTFFLFIFFHLRISSFAQSIPYTIVEKDSVVLLTRPILVDAQKSFYIDIKETLDNHPWYLKFEWTNNTDSTIYTMFGSEGVIIPITKTSIIQPGKSDSIIYKFRNVREYGGRFSQQGHIRFYKTGEDSDHLYLNGKFEWFLISGTWKYE